MRNLAIMRIAPDVYQKIVTANLFMDAAKDIHSPVFCV